MTSLEKIETYIARTKIKPETARRCCLTVEEVYLFYHMLQTSIGGQFILLVCLRESQRLPGGQGGDEKKKGQLSRPI